MLSRSEIAAAWEGMLGQDRRGEAPDVVAFGDRLAALADRTPAEPLPLVVLPVPRRLASAPLRSIHVLDPFDHARYLAVVSRLAPCIERRLSGSVVAERAMDRPGGLTIEPWRRARRRYRRLVRRLLARRRGTLLVADVRECFGRIRPGVVVEVLERMGCAPEDVRHLEDILAGFAASGVRGLPVGPAPSAVLANAVLSIGDEAIAAEGTRHVRWVDDFLVAADGEAGADRIREALRASLAEQGLDLAERKCRTVEIDGASSVSVGAPSGLMSGRAHPTAVGRPASNFESAFQDLEEPPSDLRALSNLATLRAVSGRRWGRMFSSGWPPTRRARHRSVSGRGGLSPQGTRRPVSRAPITGHAETRGTHAQRWWLWPWWGDEGRGRCFER
jgi:hypothetical protein